eukprot:CCRYP_020256-RA/>CCRYP_020256-RA protein AED:0.12 eAED:0.12 QI:0/0.88/0.8/1/0.55/0.2/10/1680/409
MNSSKYLLISLWQTTLKNGNRIALNQLKNDHAQTEREIPNQIYSNYYFGVDQALFEINKISRQEMAKREETGTKNQMKNPKEGKNEKKQENKKNEKAQQNESKKDKKKSPGKKEQTSKNLFDTKKKKKESVKKDEAKKKKQDDENKQQEDSKKPKKKPDKKEKKQTTNDKKANNKNKLDNRAIRIRERCQTPLNIYRTCYERAVDPSNNLDDDQFQLRNPFSQPFIDHDEWMVADTMHVELTQEAIVMKNGEVQCNDMLAMEELILKYLKDNIGNSDTFSPICAFIGDSAIENELVNDGSGKVMETIALKIDVVFAFKRQFAQEIESSSQQNELHRHLLERNLTGCNRGGYGLCCSSKAFNSREQEVLQHVAVDVDQVNAKGRKKRSHGEACLPATPGQICIKKHSIKL